MRKLAITTGSSRQDASAVLCCAVPIWVLTAGLNRSKVTRHTSHVTAALQEVSVRKSSQPLIAPRSLDQG
jgi:hypothetical protein